MPSFSLTGFVDIVASSGASKLTHVRRIKERPAYRPALDFYKPLREAIIAAHRDGRRKDSLNQLLKGLTDKKKKSNYPSAVKGYKKWWGRKSLNWFSPPRETWEHRDVEVSVNPELGLRIKDEPVSVKLYFKADKLSKRRVDCILHLMESMLCDDEENLDVGVLDVRRSKLFRPTVNKPHLEAALRAEAAYVAEAWAQV